MVKINRKIEEIHNKLIKCFPNNKVDVDININMSLMKSSISNKSKPTFEIRAYISNHKFKLSDSNFSNYCDSIEGFITHINYEMQNIDGWKPIKELKSRIV